MATITEQASRPPKEISLTDDGDRSKRRFVVYLDPGAEILRPKTHNAINNEVGTQFCFPMDPNLLWHKRFGYLIEIHAGWFKERILHPYEIRFDPLRILDCTDHDDLKVQSTKKVTAAEASQIGASLGLRLFCLITPDPGESLMLYPMKLNG